MYNITQPPPLSVSFLFSKTFDKKFGYMTLPCVWHDSFICVTWLIHMCDMTHSDVWHNASPPLSPLFFFSKTFYKKAGRLEVVILRMLMARKIPYFFPAVFLYKVFLGQNWGAESGNDMHGKGMQRMTNFFPRFFFWRHISRNSWD